MFVCGSNIVLVCVVWIDFVDEKDFIVLFGNGFVN